VKPPGHQMTFTQALHQTSMDLMLKVSVPAWALGLTPRLRLARTAFDELGVGHVQRKNEEKWLIH
jgi:hypothetical protein